MFTLHCNNTPLPSPKPHPKCSKYREFSHLAGALHDLVEDLPQAEQVHETVGAGHRSHLATTAARHSVLHQARHSVRHLASHLT